MPRRGLINFGYELGLSLKRPLMGFRVDVLEPEVKKQAGRRAPRPRDRSTSPKIRRNQRRLENIRLMRLSSLGRKHVSNAPDRMDRCLRAVVRQPFAQPVNKNFDGVRGDFLAERIKQVLHRLLGNDAAGAPHEQFERVIFPPGNLHDLAIDADFPLGGIDVHFASAMTTLFLEPGRRSSARMRATSSSISNGLHR